MKASFITQAIFISASLCAQKYNYYFGNLHAHTGFSDGSKDSVVSNISKPDAAYAYAKLSQNFDFMGISEHNHYSNNKNPGFKRPLYQLGLNMADAANENNKFLALFGMEYGVSSEHNGHVLVYGFSQLLGWENTVPGVTGNNYDIFNAKTDYDGLFRKVKNVPNAFCYLAHPNFSDFTTDGTQSTALAYASYNAAFDSAIIGLPLRSGLANSTATDYNTYPLGNYFNYYKKLLYLGYHVGIGYDHDNHNTNFGRGNGGRLVILSENLTREKLFEAMKARRFYGSDDSNAKIEFRMDSHAMGSIISGTTFPTFNVIHNDPDGEQADTIKIWKGRKSSGGLWAEIVHISNQSNATVFTDYDIKSFYEYYYFAEIKQTDGHWIVTSPIWFKTSVLLDLRNQEQKPAFNYFLSPITGKLQLSFNQCLEYKIVLKDLSGRIYYEGNFNDKNSEVDLNNFKKGLYFLRISTATAEFIKKFIIE
jgi:hypothetical protein